MLKMSDYPFAFYARDKKSKAYQADLSAQLIKDLSLSPNFSARQIALTFFVLSHYICDAHMPLHCDLRDFGGQKTKTRRIPEDLHPEIEGLWEEQFPSKEDLILHRYKTKSIDNIIYALPKNSMIVIDQESKYGLAAKINTITQDEWQELTYVCRASYALSRQWIKKPYNTVKEMIQDISQEEFSRVTNCIFHDAVEEVAAVWYKAWQRFVN
jgi:hypothetical protein